MSFAPIDLAGLHHLPWTRPAPTAGPGDTPDTGPCVLVKACGCLNGDLCTHPCDTTRDRIELAYAPVVHWLREAA